MVDRLGLLTELLTIVAVATSLPRPPSRPSGGRNSSPTIYKVQQLLQLQQAQHLTLIASAAGGRHAAVERSCAFVSAVWRAAGRRARNCLHCPAGVSSCCRSQTIARLLRQVSSSLVARWLLLKPNLQQEIAAGARRSFTVTSRASDVLIFVTH